MTSDNPNINAFWFLVVGRRRINILTSDVLNSKIFNIWDIGCLKMQ